jgi:CubicO group peptidase (beta-lactamase class C family)
MGTIMRSFAVLLALIPVGSWAILAEPAARAQESDAALGDAIRQVVKKAIAEKKLPGCVVFAGWQGKLIFQEAYGDRRIEPVREPMTVDTVFDMASLTKPIATATSVMILVDRGKIDLSDPVAKYLPQFAAHGKDAITIEHLLLHTGGLIADNPLADYQDGREQAIERIYALKPIAAPGEKFIYSDVGFIVLGMLVEKASGESLADFAQQNIFSPLDMQETMFRPGEALRKRAAPADRRDGEWIVGEVHDPRSYRLGGVAGHAGLFSTADDLAKYAQAMLEHGRRGNRQLFSDATWHEMTRPRDVSGRGLRALGWDNQTGYSSNRGKMLSAAAFGHGGFTGTSLWIDPGNDLYVGFLSNRLHPDGKGAVNPLAGRIAELVAERVGKPK